MSKLSDFAAYITSAHKESYTGLVPAERLNAVTEFYATKGLEIPAVITVTSTKKSSYLTKDERFNISNAIAMAAINGTEITEEMKSNLIALSNPDAIVTTTVSAAYKDSVNTFGASVVAAKLIDALDVTNNEEFHKIRKFDVPANVSIDAIPAFIKELQAIYDAAKKSE